MFFVFNAPSSNFLNILYQAETFCAGFDEHVWNIAKETDVLCTWCSCSETCFMEIRYNCQYKTTSVCLQRCFSHICMCIIASINPHQTQIVNTTNKMTNKQIAFFMLSKKKANKKWRKRNEKKSSQHKDLIFLFH